MKALPRRILLATDGSGDAALASRAAADLSARTGAWMHVVHAWRTPPPPLAYPGFPGTLQVPTSEECEREAREVLEKQVEILREAEANIVGVHLRRGNPVDEILDIAEDAEADLIVVGSGGLGPFARILLGSVSEGVVHHASCPVLVVRGGEHAWPPARIVIGDDASEEAEKAGEVAASIGKLFGAEGLVVRAYQPVREVYQEGPLILTREIDDRFSDAGALAKRASRISKTLGSLPGTRAVVGDATLAILEAARESNIPTLIAVGCRGLGPIKRARLGSVSTKVVRAADGPVLVYKRPKGY